MRTREALRDLQERLAHRLQAPDRDAAQARWLGVQAGRGRYLLPLGQAGEIFPFAPPHPVPYTQPWFLGVVHLRGGLWATVDLAGFMGGDAAGLCATEGRAAAQVAAARADARLVTFHPLLDVNAVLRIDRLAGLRGPGDFVASAPAQGGAPAWYGSRYTDAQGETWQELSLLALARDPQFLALGD